MIKYLLVVLIRKCVSSPTIQERVIRPRKYTLPGEDNDGYSVSDDGDSDDGFSVNDDGDGDDGCGYDGDADDDDSLHLTDNNNDGYGDDGKVNHYELNSKLDN